MLFGPANVKLSAMKGSNASGLIVLAIAGFLALVGIAMIFSSDNNRGAPDALTAIHKSVNHFLFGVFFVVAGFVGGGIGLGIIAGAAMTKKP